MLLLAPLEYGQFSIVYLLFAFGFSIQYSVISDAWNRATVLSGNASSARSYGSALVDLSLLFGLASAIVSLALVGLRPLWWVYGLAVFFALYRGGRRYYAVAAGQSRRIAVSDISGILGFAFSLALCLQFGPEAAVAISWLVASTLSGLILKMPSRSRGEGLAAWCRHHWTSIKPLLVDSLFMDAGAIGTPFLLAGFMGSAKFGIYRAVSNVAMPVRLIIEPIRPRLGQMSPSRLLGMAASIVIGGAALVLTVACYLALALIVPALPFEVGTLTALGAHAFSTSLFVAGNLLGTVYYIACRASSPGRDIFIGRATQTALVIALPLAGFAIDDLSGAIWGFSVSSLISAMVWLYLAWRVARSTHLK
ncbi:hypothetical protein [Homoserinimonas hongtaonis]|uniref:hypothetical protein n=1 Tax=Homoserinimonas hongtaonis TaxID=2079791 RepID=UPI00131F261C|nr:hypothetical protein [Salinibacterium hongtaonis]